MCFVLDGSGEAGCDGPLVFFGDAGEEGQRERSRPDGLGDGHGPGVEATPSGLLMDGLEIRRCGYAILREELPDAVAVGAGREANDVYEPADVDAGKS